MYVLLTEEIIKTGKDMSLNKIFIAMMLSALPILGTLADGVRFLIVNAKDGTKTTFGLTEEPKISFSDGELTIVSSSRTFSISLADIQNYAFSEVSTGIEEAIKEGSVKLENGFVVFNGLAAGSKVATYLQDGKLVKESKADSNGLVVLDLSDLPKGIIILQSIKTNIKITNR